MTVPVLIVDDSPIMRAMMRKALDLSGQPSDQVFEAADGVEALELLAAGKAKLVFADIHMPRMTGVELIEKMSQDPRFSDLPVVVVSSDAGVVNQEKLKALGVKAILRKPFRPEQVRAVIRSLTDTPTTEGKP
jgi:two-component system, chemotaxis family, chemotaxis protein CheY